MSSVPLKQEIHQMLDELPPDVLPELADFLDFLRFRASREASGSRVREAIRLYVAEEISLGRAAELAGMNYFLFEELLHRQGIPVVEPQVFASSNACQCSSETRTTDPPSGSESPGVGTPG